MDRAPPSPLDRLLELADAGLRASFARPPGTRPTPGRPAAAPADDGERRHVAGLMRVNHAGEIAAQGLYHGQALTARSEPTRLALMKAAAEEGDHLAWCRERLDELGSRSSLLDPLWYAGSVAIGALAGLAGDRMSLGFMAETERQVEGHLASHLGKLPPDDLRSRAIVEQMKADEVGHGLAALAAGAAPLPEPVPRLMRLTARIMTGTAYWI
ncbi:MAG TPA: 2-polyprenyl-3-methyl-6-methoxy-1,4-benzoquinone monooxygenase [Steroidobacteraceae bacterium]|nr:2-polyprenyl-3-methyl-6-methoxy-1,4-benzoquinone monooxygenase [Steroidobacteraceae bacterium]